MKIFFCFIIEKLNTKNIRATSLSSGAGSKSRTPEAFGLDAGDGHGPIVDVQLEVADKMIPDKVSDKVNTAIGRS